MFNLPSGLYGRWVENRQLFYTDEEVAKVRKEYEDALNNMTNLISSKK